MHAPIRYTALSLLLLFGCVLPAFSTGLFGQRLISAESRTPPDVPAPNRASEPIAKELSIPRARAFNAAIATAWQSKRGCVTCHTNGLYLISGARSPDEVAYRGARREAREYLKGLIARIEESSVEESSVEENSVEAKNVEEKNVEAKYKRRKTHEALVATTAFIAISDVITTRSLDARTEKALEYVWQRQNEDGHWDWLKCNWPPYEVDDHFGVTLMAVAIGMAPPVYRKRPNVRRGLTRMKRYLRKHPPTSLHQKGMLLWVARYWKDPVRAVERQRWVAEFLDGQREDGGWRLEDLADGKVWKFRGEQPNTSSDAYATAFAVFILITAGIDPQDERVRKGLDWLARNQRQSGRWFTYSPRGSRHHFISHAATNFATMAFDASETTAPRRGK